MNALTSRVERITARMNQAAVSVLEVTYSDSPYPDARVTRRLTIALENGTLQATRGNGQSIPACCLENVLETAYQNIITVTPRQVGA